MGKGDRKTAKGKRTIGTYGNSRRKKRNDKPIKGCDLHKTILLISLKVNKKMLSN